MTSAAARHSDCPSGANLEADTRALALPQGRRVGQPGHDVALRFLLERLTEIGLTPFKRESYELPFCQIDPTIGRMREFTNLAAIIPGKNRQLDPVLIGAHYDSVIDAPCADDNATAVAVTLATAEHFSQPANQPERDLIIAIFDSEEPPYFHTRAMGSTRFYQDHCQGQIQFACVLIMDLIGHETELPIPGVPNVSKFIPGISELLFVLGAESHPAFPEVVESTAGTAQKLRVLPTLNRYIGDMSDHHAFRLGGEPFLFLSCGQGRYYHHPLDDMEWVSMDKVRRVFDYLIALVEKLDATEIALPGQTHDPAEFEIRMIQKALGLKLPILRRALQLPPLKTREDLDAFIGALAGGAGI